MDKKLITAMLIIIALTGCVTPNSGPSKGQVTLYKSPSCGCCVGWGSYMEGEGFDVKTVMVNDLSFVKSKHNIPANMESCHTAEVDGYFIEGHIPIEIVDQLLEERPDIDGIALPRMPSGSPGMPGTKSGDWTIYAIKDGKATEYEVI